MQAIRVLLQYDASRHLHVGSQYDLNLRVMRQKRNDLLVNARCTVEEGAVGIPSVYLRITALTNVMDSSGLYVRDQVAIDILTAATVNEITLESGHRVEY